MRHLAVLLSLCLVLVGSFAAVQRVAAQAFSVLVFSKTEGFRHASISDGIAAIQALGTEHGFAVTASEDAGVFTEMGLAPYQAVLFLNTTGDILNAAQQEAFEQYIRAGGGFVGIHSAADTEYDWPFYGDLIGAYFESHPQIQQATVKVADHAHPSSADLPKRWQRTDEWYNFRVNPRGKVHVLATLDESTYGGGTMGHDHPIAWCQMIHGSRAWYTAGGHTEASYADPLFRAHLLGGIRYAAGVVSGDCSATVSGNYEKVTLEDDVDNAIDLAVAPDGRVLFIEMDGAVRIYDPAASTTQQAAQLDVWEGNENGLIGIVLDPDFATNQQFYLFYTPAGAEAKQRISRFTLIDNEVDPASERILLEIPITRSQCCHAAGSMAFDAEGNLFIALGDDTNPFASDGYAPIDERPGRAPWDAQRSAGNTNDLRGAILRITPQPDGTYTIPVGNLFPNSAAGRPEIYAMGLRNPFRITVDTETGWLYWGDVGPDAQRASTSRGSEGLDEWNQARGPGNFGWPYCIGPNRAYREYDFGSGTAGPAFDCAAPTNNSPNNTGRATLPAAQPAWIWYPYGFSQDFPQLLGGSGRTAMAGPVYHYDAELSSAIKLPAYYDDTLFIYEWSRNWMMEVKLDDQGDILELNPFVPELELKRPISMRLGPDGALYVLEWGSGFGGDNQDARLVRIGYQGGPRAPVAVIDAAPTAGPVPLTVTFSAAGSYVPDSERTVDAQWDFEADGVVDATGFEVQHTYTETGTYTAQLIVTDDGGGQGVANVTITAGNTPPTVSLHAPVDGGFFEWGDGIPFGIAASDPEDGSTAVGTINCADLTFQLYVGHDDHSHPNHPLHTCTGTLQTPDGHGGEGDNIFLVVEAIYTDEGAPGTDVLTTQVQHLLHPRRIQAEHFSTNEGTVPETTGDTAGGARNLGFIDDGDHISFDRMNLTDIGFVTYRVASAGPGGRIEVHVDARDGPLISTAYVEPTGQWQVYRDVTTPINDPSGTHDLFFVFKSDLGTTGLFNLNWIDFHGPGVADRTLRGDGGLTAIYFSTPDFSGPGITRIDPQVNFNWRTDAPLVSLPADHFSVRWTGQVKAAFDEAYTFHVRSRDAMRMWLGDQLLIDFAGASSVEEVSSAPVALAAGQRYDVMVEVAHTTGEAQVHLVWSSASMPKAIVPARLLYPDAETGTATDTSPVIPDQLRLDPAFPNPFTEATTFTVDLPTGGHVQLEMFDVTGRRVALLEDGMRGAGRYAVRFSPEGLPSGVYLCRLTTPVGIRTQQIVMVR